MKKKKKFQIKDNVGFGEWDYDALANEWNSELLNSWGLEVPDFGEMALIENEGVGGMQPSPKEPSKMICVRIGQFMFFVRPEEGSETCEDIYSLFYEKAQEMPEQEAIELSKKVERALHEVSLGYK